MADAIDHAQALLGQSVVSKDRVWGFYRGHTVEFLLVTRGAASSSEAWTEIRVEANVSKLLLQVVPQEPGHEEHVREGRGTDIRLGDRRFDALFLVESAPADVMRILFNADLRRRLVALHPVGIVPCDGGIQIEKKGWMEDPNAIHEAIDLVTCLVERIPGSVAEVDSNLREVRGSYRDPPVDRTKAVAADREAEIAEVARKKEARLSYEQRKGCLITLAIIAISMLVSYLVALAGEALNPW